jgi:hypothetical protein
MDTNVKIILSDGNVLDAVGISFIHVDAFNKDYIFYSLNELANGNMDKIYIAEATQNGTTPNPLSDDEWDNIKRIMLNISHNEPVSGISYKPLNGLTFNVGEAKKLAIKGDKKQAFIDAQNKAIAPTTAIDEPAFVSDQAANGTPFFDPATQQSNAPAVAETTIPSAFAMQPPIAQEVPVESLETDNVIQQPVVNHPVVAPAAPKVVETPAVPVATNNQTVAEPVVQTTANEPFVVETNKVEQPIPVVNTNSGIDSLEDLEAAIIDLQNGINKINEYIKSLKNKNTVVVNTTQVQTIATGQTPVATEVMNIAEQPEIITDSLGEESTLSNDTPPTPVIDQISTNVINSTIDTSIDTNLTNVLDTSVNVNVDEPISPQVINTAVTQESGEPAFSVDNSNFVQPQMIDLNNTGVIPTPNSATSINSSTVAMNIPEAPVVEDNTPQIPITPLESTSIPEAPVIPTVSPVENVVATPVAPAPEVAQPVQQVQPVAQNVQSVPEINVAPVQQVPTLDLSAINTNVTLPTDMTANPTPNNGQQGVFGPASLDAQSDMAA